MSALFINTVSKRSNFRIKVNKIGGNSQMAYSINGKVITDYPLMDEICYNCKLILKSIVIKNDILADSKETEDSIPYAEMNALIDEYGYVDFDTFYFTEEILVAYGYSEANAKRYVENRFAIPEEDRDSLTAFANDYFIEHFEEENDYYRMLGGLPPYNTGDQYYIWLTSSDIPEVYTETVDFSLPLHEQPSDLINLLYVDGVIDKLREIYPGSAYSYMMYLGDRAIDMQFARAAKKWDILYLPQVHYLVRDSFIDKYQTNREIYMNRSYQEFFAESGEYYDQMMILIVLAQTFADMVTDVPEWYIRRDIFDLRSCKYFLESSGVEYFKEIPLKYQIRIVKNLNKLIKYKSSSQNVEDIIDIFDIDGTSLYKYWLYKKPTTDGYDLQFIASKYNESYDAYIKNSRYRYQYNVITMQDKYWDGEDDHNTVKSQILDKEFTIEGTKYMSIEYNISMEEYLYQMEYLLGLILDSNIYDDLGNIKIGIPTINETALFKLSDVFLFLCVMSASFYRENLDSRETRVRIPNMHEGSEPRVDEDHYDWKKKTFPEMYVVKNGRVGGFNSSLDKETLVDILERRHSHLIFGSSEADGIRSLTDAEYKVEADKWIDALGVNNFIIPDNITDIPTLMQVYHSNTTIYKALKQAIVDADNHNDYVYLNYIFQELFTKPFDIGFVSRGELLYTDLIDILKDRDYILYEVYYSIMQEQNIETKQDMMRLIMSDVIETLEYYINGEGTEFLYSFVSIESFDAVVKYLYMMLNFFKSYKVYFLDPYYTLVCDDQLNNSAKAYDEIAELRLSISRYDKALVEDIIPSIDIDVIMIDEGEHVNQNELVDIYAHHEFDPLEDLDFDGIDAERGEQEQTIDINGGGDDERQCLPYTTINGGPATQSDVTLDDINGGDETTYSKEYYDLDGGPAYNGNDYRTDAMGSQQFNYIIDGGSAAPREFLNNNLHIWTVGKDIYAQVVISPDSLIILNDDGLYVPSNTFPTPTDMDHLTYEQSLTIKYLQDNYDTIMGSVTQMMDKDYRDSIYARNRDYQLRNILYALTMWRDDTFKNSVKQYVDDFCANMLDTLDDDDLLNPYTFTDL